MSRAQPSPPLDADRRSSGSANPSQILERSSSSVHGVADNTTNAAADVAPTRKASVVKKSWRSLKDHMETSALTIKATVVGGSSSSASAAASSSPKQQRRGTTMTGGDDPAAASGVFASLSNNSSIADNSTINELSIRSNRSSARRSVSNAADASKAFSEGGGGDGDTGEGGGGGGGGVSFGAAFLAMAKAHKSTSSGAAGSSDIYASRRSSCVSAGSEVSMTLSEIISVSFSLNCIRSGRVGWNEESQRLSRDHSNAFVWSTKNRSSNAQSTSSTAPQRASSAALDDLSMPPTNDIMDRLHPGGIRAVAVLLKKEPNTTAAVDSALQDTALDIVEATAKAVAEFPSNAPAAHCIVPETGCVVTLWRSRRSGRMYQRVMASIAAAVRTTLLPSFFRSCAVVGVVWRGLFFSVTWPPAISSTCELPIALSGMATAAAEMVSTALTGVGHAEAELTAIRVYSCSDATYCFMPSPRFVEMMSERRSELSLVCRLLVSSPGQMLQKTFIRMLSESAEGLEYNMKRSATEKVQFLSKLFHFHGVRMMELMTFRQFLLRQLPEEAALREQDPRAPMMHLLCSVMLNEVVARVLKGMILSRSNFSASASILMGNSVASSSPLEIADAATTVMRKMLSGSSKFLQESLLPGIAKRFPCEHASSFELGELSMVDVAQFLSHRLALEYAPLAKKFIVPSGGLGDTSTCPPIFLGYSHRAMLAPTTASMLPELSQSLTSLAHTSSQFNAAEMSSALAIAIFYGAASVALKLANSNIALNLALQVMPLRGKPFNFVVIHLLTQLRPFLGFHSGSQASATFSSTATGANTTTPTEEKLLRMAYIQGLESVGKIVNAAGTANVESSPAGAAAAPLKNGGGGAVAAPASLPSEAVVLCEADSAWVHRLLCLHGESMIVAAEATATESTASKPSPRMASQKHSSSPLASAPSWPLRFLCLWAQALTYGACGLSSSTWMPRHFVGDGADDERESIRLDDEDATFVERQFWLTPSACSTFLSLMLSKQRWIGIVRGLKERLGTATPALAASAQQHVITALLVCIAKALGCNTDTMTAGANFTSTLLSLTPQTPVKHKLEFVVKCDGKEVTAEDAKEMLCYIWYCIGFSGPSLMALKPKASEPSPTSDPSSTTMATTASMNDESPITSPSAIWKRLLCFTAQECVQGNDVAGGYILLGASAVLGLEWFSVCCLRSVAQIMWRRFQEKKFATMQDAKVYLASAIEKDSVFVDSTLDAFNNGEPKKRGPRKSVVSLTTESSSTVANQRPQPPPVPPEWLKLKLHVWMKTQLQELKALHLAKRPEVFVPKNSKNTLAVEVAELKLSLPALQPGFSNGTYICSVCLEKTKLKIAEIEKKIAERTKSKKSSTLESTKKDDDLAPVIAAAAEAVAATEAELSESETEGEEKDDDEVKQQDEEGGAANEAVQEASAEVHDNAEGSHDDGHHREEREHPTSVEVGGHRVDSESEGSSTSERDNMRPKSADDAAAFARRVSHQKKPVILPQISNRFTKNSTDFQQRRPLVSVSKPRPRKIKRLQPPPPAKIPTGLRMYAASQRKMLLKSEEHAWAKEHINAIKAHVRRSIYANVEAHASFARNRSFNHHGEEHSSVIEGTNESTFSTNIIASPPRLPPVGRENSSCVAASGGGGPTTTTTTTTSSFRGMRSAVLSPKAVLSIFDAKFMSLRNDEERVRKQIMENESAHFFTMSMKRMGGAAKKARMQFLTKYDRPKPTVGASSRARPSDGRRAPETSQLARGSISNEDEDDAVGACHDANVEGLLSSV